MAFKYIAPAFGIRGLRSTERLLLLELADIADNNGYLFAGNKHLAERAGLKPRTVRRDLARLRQLGLIRRDQREGRSAETWLLYPPLEWSGNGSMLRAAPAPYAGRAAPHAAGTA